MRKLIFYLLCLSFLFIPWSGGAQSRARAEALSLAVEKDLTAGILPFWLEHAVDPRGGFYGAVSDEGSAGSNSVSQRLPVEGGRVSLDLPAESFVSIFVR